MFDHLDDPDGFTPSKEFRESVHRRGGTLRRRHRVALMGTTVAGCLVLAVGGITLAADRRLDEVDRVDVGAADPGGADNFDKPFNVLIVGTDGGRGLDGVEGVRSDTIMMVRIDPAGSRAIVFPLPRDLYLPINGTGGENRINTAIAGGPERLAATIEDFGIPVDRYVGIDFEGMQAMVDAVDGVDVNFPVPMRDRASGLAIEEAGCVRLDGGSALALARARHLEQLVGGDWRADPSSDLGRIKRQVLLGRIMLGVFSRVGADPVELERLTGVFADHATVDAALSNRDLVELARAIHRIGSDSVFELSLPVETTEMESGAIVLTVDGDASPLLRIMDGTDTDEFFDQGPASGGTGTTAPAPTDLPTIGHC